VSVSSAALAELPQISGSGRNETHVVGRSGRPNSAQRTSSVRCGQRSPAGLPIGSAAHGEIDGAMQHAPHPDRQLIVDATRQL